MSAPSIVLLALNQNMTLATMAEATGALPSVPVTNATTINGIVGPLVDVQNAFLFYTTADIDANFPANISDVGHANFSVLPKVATTPIFTTAAVQTGAWVPADVANGDDLRTAYHEVNQKLASAVFGSEQAVDYFSNTQDLMVNTADVITEAVLAINDDVTTGVVREMFNYLLNKFPERFQLKHNASITGASLESASKFLNLTLIGANGGRATVNVELTAADTVSVINNTVVLSDAALFAENESVEISDSYGGSNVDIKFLLTAALASALSSETGVDAAFATALEDPDFFASVTATAPIGWYTGLIAVGSAQSSEAEVSIVYDATGEAGATAIASMFVTSISSSGKSGPSTPFDSSDSVTVADHLSISSINSIQIGMLNGTLNDPAGTPAPLYEHDKIATFIIINSHADQMDTLGKNVKAQYVAQYLYDVVATIPA